MSTKPGQAQVAYAYAYAYAYARSTQLSSGVRVDPLVGEITPRPVVVDGRVQVRDMLPITATIDHRYADGWHVGQAMKAFRAYLAAPEQFEPAITVREVAVG